MPHHARAAMWTSAHSHRWFARCDQCGRWRLFGWYYELYPPLHSTGSEAGWWWACADCLVDIISDRLFDREPADAPWGEWDESTETGWNTIHQRRGMPDTRHVAGTRPAQRCDLCRAMKDDRGPTVGETLTDAQRFREELEADGLL